MALKVPRRVACVACVACVARVGRLEPIAPFSWPLTSARRTQARCFALTPRRFNHHQQQPPPPPPSGSEVPAEFYKFSKPPPSAPSLASSPIPSQLSAQPSPGHSLNQQQNQSQNQHQNQYGQAPPPRRGFRIFTWKRAAFLVAFYLGYTRLEHAHASGALRIDTFSRYSAPEVIRGLYMLYDQEHNRGNEAERDEHIRRELRNLSDTMPLVQDLTADPDWEEWPTTTTGGPASDAQSGGQAHVRLTTGPLGGVDGLGGLHRIWRNIYTGEIMSVLYIGPKLTGWPQVTHGGALATILDEAMGRCAIRLLAASTAVTAQLGIEYRKMSPANTFYLVHCVPDITAAEMDDLVEEANRTRGTGTTHRPDGSRIGTLHRRKITITVNMAPIDLEDGSLGEPTVAADSLFVVPRKFNLPKVEHRF